MCVGPRLKNILAEGLEARSREGWVIKNMEYAGLSQKCQTPLPNSAIGEALSLHPCDLGFP